MSGTERTHQNLLSLTDAADWDAVIGLTEDLSAADPPGFWFFRAAALTNIQRAAEAVAIAKQGITKNPASGWGNRVLFDALHANGQTDEAFREYRTYIETHEGTEEAKALYVLQAAELNLFDIASDMNDMRDVIKDVPKKPRFALGIQCFCKHDTLEKVFASLCDLDGADRFSLILLQDSAYLSNNPEKYADGVEKVREVIANWLPQLMTKFFSVECLENKRNLGTAPSCRRLIDYITERHDGFLFVEDDCILAPSALDWTVHHLEHTIASDGPWFVTCESIFFDKGHRPLDDDLKARLSNISAYDVFRESYIQLPFVNSTCFATHSDIWKRCAGPRSFTRGPESLTRFVAQWGMKTLAPVVPRASDIGMLHELGYSVEKMGAANVREIKNVYLTCADPFVGDLCYEFVGDRDLIFRATSKLVPESVEAIEDKYASGDLTDIRVRECSTLADRTCGGDGQRSNGWSTEFTTTPGIVAGTHSFSENDMPSAAFQTGSNMLEKTRALLADVKPGTYLPDDVECYDPGEIDALGGVLKRLLYAPSSIRRVLQQKYGVTITRADFYSEIPTVAELEKSFASPSLLKLDGIFPDNATMVAELDRLMSVSHEFDPPVTSSRPGEYAWEGGPFSYSDAMSYYTMIRTRKPRTIVEIGSGWSTLIAQMACAKNGMGRIVCIERYPSELLKAMGSIELIERRAQDIETSFLTSLMKDGDLLFIDSTHTIKHDGDCLHIYLRLLPSVRADITVHVHDIFLPDTLSLKHMRDNQLFWNEQYLLYAYLSHNPRTRTIYGSRYHGQRNPERLDQFMHGRCKAGGASLWFEQKSLP